MGITGTGGGVRTGVSVGVRVGELVGVWVGVCVEVGVTDAVGLFVTVGVTDGVAVNVGVAVMDGDAVGLGVGDSVRVSVAEGVGDGGTVFVGVAVTLAVGVIVAVGELVSVLVGVGVGPTCIVAPVVLQGMDPPDPSSKRQALIGGPPQLVEANETLAKPFASPWNVMSNRLTLVPDRGVEHAKARQTEPSTAKLDTALQPPPTRAVAAVTLSRPAGYTIPRV